MLQRWIEEVALNAWPSHQQTLYDGWLLRFSNGYSMRGNSINPLFPSSIDVHEKIETCEKIYAERELPPLFRMTPSATPAELDNVLEARKYKKAHPTSVLYLRLQKQHVLPEDETGFKQEPIDRWLSVFQGMRGLDRNAEKNHAAIVQSIPATVLAAVVNTGGESVACGLGVLERDYFGLFDIITHPEHRGRGHATRLISGMLHWAYGHDASHVYLQVEKDNIRAHGLYAKFGFYEIYHYWYRTHPSSAQFR